MLSVSRILQIVLLATLSTSCASGPTYAELSPRIPPIPAEQGRIFFYRPSSLGAAVTPQVELNEEEIGASKAKGFFFVDRPPGDYRATASTEVKRSASFTLAAQQTRYIHTTISMGFFVGHLNLSMVDPEEGLAALAKMHFTGDETQLLAETDPEEPKGSE